MSGAMSHASSAEPNLTPILDMVFQLITFFMLVINFKAASMDLDLKLPVVGSARPVENSEGRDDLLVLNINSEGKLKVYGQLIANVDGYIRQEAGASLLVARGKNPNAKADDLPSIVVIRADKSTPFKMLNQVITTCQTHGFRNFALKAMNKEA
jgi:biopolymer transport protein ExbD